MEPRCILAGNPGPFTLDGTRSYLVGVQKVAIIDPGPDVESHIRAVVRAVETAQSVRILVTHHHEDHAGAVDALAAALGAPVLGTGHPLCEPLQDGELIATDQGDLAVLETPGHASQHLAFYWEAAKAVFAGDVILGEGNTTWVGEYPGAVADYLGSLDRIRATAPEVIYPAHGALVLDATACLDAYEAHRRARIEQVRRALSELPGASVLQLVDRVYGNTIPAGLEGAARKSVEAILDFLESSE